MVRLSVNINKVALIRNSRGGDLPDLRTFALDCEDFGAEGITVHPRPDQRHIRYEDVQMLRECVRTELNVEGYPSEPFMEMVKKVKPDQCTLVPDPPYVLTSNTGWDTEKEKPFLSEVVRELQSAGIRVSLFLNPEPGLVEHAAATGADRIELYTGGYAEMFAADRSGAVRAHMATAVRARECKLGVNAGHDLNLDNLKYYADRVEGLLEVSIGHALICDSLYYGVENAIQMYKSRLR